MTRTIIMLSVIALAACDSGANVTATNASVADVAANVEAAGSDETLLRPGKWMLRGQIDDVQAPGMPAEVAAQIKQAGVEMDGAGRCVSEAEVRKPAPEFFTGNKGCTYDHFTMGGGKVDARLRCSSGGNTQVTAMTGIYGPELYRMAMTTTMESPAGSTSGMEGVVLKLTVEGKRVGACDAPGAAPKQETAS